MAAQTVDDPSNKQLLVAITGMFAKQTEGIDERFEQQAGVIDAKFARQTESIVAKFEQQADAIADMFAHQAEQMATKDDLQDVKNELKGNIAGIEVRLERKFEQLGRDHILPSGLEKKLEND